MKFKNGTKEVLKNVFSFTDDISVFKSRMSFDEFKKGCLEYSGNEAKNLVDFYTPCKSKRFINGRSTPRTVKGGHLPDSFFKEWDATTKHFKKLFLGQYLTQEFFETNPVATLKYCWNALKHEHFDRNSEPSIAWTELDKFSRKLAIIEHNFFAVEMLLKRIENCKGRNLLCDLEEVY